MCDCNAIAPLVSETGIRQGVGKGRQTFFAAEENSDGSERGSASVEQRHQRRQGQRSDLQVARDEGERGLGVGHVEQAADPA